VKRHEFIKYLVQAGCVLYRHGKKHDIFINPQNGRKAPVPRHVEIRNSLCELIKNSSAYKFLLVPSGVEILNQVQDDKEILLKSTLIPLSQRGKRCVWLLS